jgi:hypothetical protein
MTKEDLLKQIAESAYNIGFGAKKSFATFDIVDKIPGILNFCALAIGILALVIDELNIKIVSASLIIFGGNNMCLLNYNRETKKYKHITYVERTMVERWYNKEHLKIDE